LRAASASTRRSPAEASGVNDLGAIPDGRKAERADRAAREDVAFDVRRSACAGAGGRVRTACVRGLRRLEHFLRNVLALAQSIGPAAAHPEAVQRQLGSFENHDPHSLRHPFAAAELEDLTRRPGIDDFSM